MEMGYYLLVVPTGIVVLTWALSVINWVWLRPIKLQKSLRKQGFSGNSYRVLLGDTTESFKMTRQARSTPINLSDDIVPRIMPFVHKTVVTYGKKSFMWFGPKPRVNIMDPELIKEILTKNFRFRKPHSNPLVRLLATGLATYEDEQWVKHRKLINPAFHMEKLKNMLPAFHLSCSEMVNTWEKIISAGSGEVDVWPYLQTLSSDAISRTAFGSNYEEGRKIFQLQTEQAELATQSLHSVYIPTWRFIPTKMNKRMKQIEKEVKLPLTDIINKRMKEMTTGESGNNNDLLGILLESSMKEIENHDNMKKVGMNITDVIEECKLFYLAGQETTTSLLVWTMILLSMHQYWQQQARKEVLEVFGSKEPNYDGLSRLKIVTMILNEVLRLYPPGVSLTRTINEETKLGEMSIPAGVLLSLPIILLHHDAEIWGNDVKEFKPERFSEGVSGATTNRQLSYFPFGWGPRVCIGQNFTMLEAKMSMAMILQRFSFDLSPSYAHAPSTTITLKPQYGAHLILHKLKDST